MTGAQRDTGAGTDPRPFWYTMTGIAYHGYRDCPALTEQRQRYLRADSPEEVPNGRLACDACGTPPVAAAPADGGYRAASPVPQVADPRTLPTASFRVLATVERTLPADALDALRDRLSNALPAFPALAGETVTVGRQPDTGRSDDPYASADGWNRIVRVPANHACNHMTVFHELGHCAIRARVEAGADLPTTSEEFCSIFSVARMPGHLVDEDTIPYLGEPGIPRASWPKVCRGALRYREDHQAYIKWCRERLHIGTDDADQSPSEVTG